MRLKQLILLFVLSAPALLFAQNSPPDNWFNLDYGENNIPGISTEKTYQTLLKGKNSETVIVAVIDSGVDYEHEDLKDVIWINEDEIPGNGIDDDKNGYVDDINGWNFIGGKNGNVETDTYEATRIYRKLRKKYENVGPSSVSGKDKKEFALYEEVKKEVLEKKEEAANNLAQIQATTSLIVAALEATDQALGDRELNLENIKSLDAGTDRNLMIGKEILIQALGSDDFKSVKEVQKELGIQIEEATEHYSKQLEHYDPDFDPRSIVGDDYENSYEKGYGNNDVRGPDARHGTHVAGIIAAVRNNDLGINGIAENVKIMSVRAVPDGDERDKDVANAIIYAVDNGASIINMSFGKGYSWDKEAVDKAVKYAQKRDVLLVHAAGNSAQDNDTVDNFPNDSFKKRGLFKPKQAKNWIEVGACSWTAGEEMVAEFSNYGKANVDIFAPGVAIYSTIPDNKYESLPGTSMASPMVAGVAAILRSYFPELTALQVKEIILNSAARQSRKVYKPGSDEKVNFSDLSLTGGIVNVNEAVKLAMQTKGKKKVSKSTDKTIRP